MNVLMVGVSEKRTGGMWTVAKTYIESEYYNKCVNLKYIATSSSGSVFSRMVAMAAGYMNIAKTVNAGHVDIIHVHMAERGSTFRKGIIVRYAKKRNIKTIVHIHAGPFPEWFNGLSEWKQKRIRDYLSHADCFIVLGKYWKGRFSPLIPEDKIRVIYNGIKPQRDNKYDLGNKNIIYMGRINEKKGIWDLVEAVKTLDPDLDKSYRFLIYGEDETGGLQDRISEEGLEERIVLMGWMSEHQKEEAYLGANLLVLPTYVEGLSVTILEAMSYGIPIVTTDVTTMPEILSDIVPLVSPGRPDELAQMIRSMLGDKSLLKEISDKEFLRANTMFSDEMMIRNTLEVYREVSE